MALFKKKNNSDKDYKILVNKNGKNERLEGYNRLKDNVLYMNTDGKTKVFQIESSVEAEGKTTVACNLAVSLALVNKKVVVVDLDFHRPRVHQVFEVEKENGIAEYILGNASMILFNPSLNLFIVLFWAIALIADSINKVNCSNLSLFSQ